MKTGTIWPIKKNNIEPGSLFADIENPVQWQKDIRNEWNAYWHQCSDIPLQTGTGIGNVYNESKSPLHFCYHLYGSFRLSIQKQTRRTKRQGHLWSIQWNEHNALSICSGKQTDNRQPITDNPFNHPWAITPIDLLTHDFSLQQQYSPIKQHLTVLLHHPAES